ncbi:hypothetical protein FE257_012866 [Aspergillus nanangensis]|uniref:CENP-S associating centromere protein X-domain-containing protein n=1 Tax=Aspergillus nanangensis TaxID=2582783 RepID=A0AAD4GRM7_ASPNN|nr:hypothetical protein FE257_012866 [Aspergillus nanangensis]
MEQRPIMSQMVQRRRLIKAGAINYERSTLEQRYKNVRLLEAMSFHTISNRIFHPLCALNLYHSIGILGRDCTDLSQSADPVDFSLVDTISWKTIDDEPDRSYDLLPPKTQPPPKRRHLPFKPPRRQSTAAAGPSTAVPSASSSKVKKPAIKPKKPTTKPKKTNATASASAFKPAQGFTSARNRLHAATESPASGDSNPGSGSGSGSESSSASDHERAASQEPDYILAEITQAEPDNDITLGEPTVPAKLLTKLLHHHFQNGKTKIAKDANEVVAKYVDVFVREALARAAYERSEGGGGSSVADGFLEVEDLEKMAPQLVLDF